MVSVVLGFTLLKAHDFDYSGRLLRCNDWQIDLRATKKYWIRTPLELEGSLLDSRKKPCYIGFVVRD